MNARPTTTRLLLTGSAVAALLLAGCGDDGDEGADSTTTTTEASSSSSSSSASTEAETTSTPATEPAGSAPATDAPTTEPPTPCTGEPSTPPAVIEGREVGDLDGDGQPDTAYLSADVDEGSFLFGIRYATGRTSGYQLQSAGTEPRIALVVDVDGDGRTEAIAGTTRGTTLLAIEGCEVVPITGEDGEPYRFDYQTDAPGTGVGCVDTDEGQRLVGLDVVSSSDTEVEWTRTVIEIDGTTARNGEVESGTYQRPEDGAAIDLLSQTTCGDLTVEADGITFTP